MRCQIFSSNSTFLNDEAAQLARPGGRITSRNRRIRAKLILVLSGIAVGLAIAEISLRAIGFSYFNPYTVDEALGMSHRPYAEGWWNLEGHTYVHINSQGFHDREHSIAKPSNTIRIAVLGDSFAEALQVPADQAFWSVMEREFPRCAAAKGSQIEVLNFGVSNFSTGRELLMLRRRVWQYSPDIVMLLVTPGNDIRDNSAKLTTSADQSLPYFFLDHGQLKSDDSKLVARNQSLGFRLRRSAAGHALEWLRDHSRVLGVFYAARESFAAPPQPTNSPGAEAGMDDEVLHEPADENWRDAWGITEALVVTVRDEVRAKGAQFVVAIGSRGIQVDPDIKTRENYMKRLGVANLYYADERLKALGEREGFSVITLAPELADYAARNHVWVHGSGQTLGRGHWNAEGHRLAGEIITRELCRQVVPQVRG